MQGSPTPGVSERGKGEWLDWIQEREDHHCIVAVLIILFIMVIIIFTVNIYHHQFIIIEKGGWARFQERGDGGPLIKNLSWGTL